VVRQFGHGEDPGKRQGEVVGADKGKQYLKYGGVAFTNNVPPEEINRFVRELPEEDRQSLYQVVHKLQDAGLITVHDGDVTTIDDEMEPYLETGPEAQPGRGGPERSWPIPEH
jgi:hypothetical protein